MTAPRTVPKPQVTHIQFLASVMELLQATGWRRVNFRKSQVRPGRWVTHGSGDVKGWPDIFAVRGKRSLALEIKVGRDKPSDEQTEWLEDLGQVGVEAHVIRPDTWDFLERICR